MSNKMKRGMKRKLGVDEMAEKVSSW